MALHLGKKHALFLHYELMRMLKDGSTPPNSLLDLGTDVTDELGWIWI